jgi:hypothetical protein
MGKNKGYKGPLWPIWDLIKEPIISPRKLYQKILAIKAIAKEAATAPFYKLFHQIIMAIMVLALYIKKEPLMAYLI